MTDNKTLVIYHGNCADGFTAAWLLHRTFTLQERQVDYHAARYGETCPAPLLEDSADYKYVFIVDFSYKREDMDELTRRFPETIFTVIDHHKSAKEQLLGHPKIYFCYDDQCCGAKLTQKFLSRSLIIDEAPWFVEYVNDRDLWKHALPNTEEVNAYIAMLPYTFEAWDQLAQTSIEEVIAAGKALLDYRKKVIDGLCKGRIVVDIFGYKGIPVVNTSKAFASDTGQRLSELHPEAPFTLTYQFAHGNFLCSLRSAEDGEDVARIAEAFGGGGHMHAAGCSISQDSPYYFPTMKALKILPPEE